MTAALAQQLSDDLKQAMRGGDQRRRDVIRFLRAAITNAAIDKRRDLTDDEILAVIRNQIKQRRDSIEMFRAGGRDELADEEAAQLEILHAYLPPQLSEDEVRTLVKRLAEELGVSSPRDMSRLMPAVMQEVGSRAEGRLVSQLARDELARRAQSGAA